MSDSSCRSQEFEEWQVRGISRRRASRKERPALILEKLAETPDKPEDSAVSTK
jgi:hypothetical protein